MRLLITTTALSIGLAGAVAAQEFSLGGGVSTLGPMIEGTVTINQNFGIRGVGYIPFGVDVNNIDVGNDYTLDSTINLGSAALLADWYPWGGGARVSGGVFIGQDELASGSFTSAVAGNPNFNGSLNFDNSVAPMLSVGYQYDFASGWYLSGDIGAVIAGVSAQSPNTNAQVQSEIDQINDALNDVPAIPYIAISIGFTF